MRRTTETPDPAPIERRSPLGAKVAARMGPSRWFRRASARAEAALGRGKTWLGDRRGAAGVEFAMLALPFITLLGVNAESGIVVLAQQTLDVSVDRASRLLRTGEFQDRADGSDPTQRLRQIMCNGPGIFFVCRDVRIDVTRAESFKTSPVAEPYDKQTQTFSANFGTRFQCPTGNDVIAVRAAVPILRLFGFLDFSGRRLSDNRQLLVSTAIFRAEAYDPKPCQ